MIAAAISGWFGTLTALPMSWSSDANTISSSAPPRSASVAVCSECVSWSTANPSVISASERSMSSARSATRRLVLDGLAPDDRPLLGGRLVHAGEGRAPCAPGYPGSGEDELCAGLEEVEGGATPARGAAPSTE